MKIDDALIQTAEKERSRKNSDLKKVCKDFESIFTYEMLKSMRRTIDKCDLFSGGQGEEMYESMLDQELAKNIAGKGSNSIGDLLYQQLKGRYDEGITNANDFSNKEAATIPGPSWPVNGRVSSRFGWRKDPFTGDDRYHKGVDIAAPQGSEIKAVMAGRVLKCDNQKGYGRVVVIDHGNGLSTLYAHNSKISVKEGDWIKQGEKIGEVGSTGRSTGPHLHFEVRRNNRQIDPEGFLKV